MAETEIETPPGASEAGREPATPSPSSRAATSIIAPTDAADEVLAAYEAWIESFRAMTRRARSRFLGRQWRESQIDAAARMDLYPAAVARAVDALRAARVDG